MALLLSVILQAMPHSATGSRDALFSAEQRIIALHLLGQHPALGYQEFHMLLVNRLKISIRQKDVRAWMAEHRPTEAKELFTSQERAVALQILNESPGLGYRAFLLCLKGRLGVAKP